MIPHIPQHPHHLPLPLNQLLLHIISPNIFYDDLICLIKEKNLCEMNLVF